MPRWSVVLKKEASGRRISSTGLEDCLGQEESNDNRYVFPRMQGQQREGGDDNDELASTRRAQTGTT